MWKFQPKIIPLAGMANVCGLWKQQQEEEGAVILRSTHKYYSVWPEQ